MPFIKVYIHFVWSTKNRAPLLSTKEIRQKVWNHIKENARNKGIFIDYVNGYCDHCHCLVSMNSSQTIQQIMQLIKGESSFWINKHLITEQKFEWQDAYYAVSVSESMIETVRNYIKNQEEHHLHNTFNQEFEEFISKHGFQKFEE